MDRMEKIETPVDPELLFEAFETFTRTSEALEKSYEELQKKASEMNLELESTNKELADNLQENERISTHLRAILSSMRDGVLAYDLEGLVTMANSAAGILLDMEVKELVDCDINELLVCAVGYLPPILKDHCHKGSCQCHVDRGSDQAVLQLGHYTLLDSHQRTIGGIITIEDITQTTFAREQREQNERLAAMGKMAVNIVHEIRNPMGSIELLASLLRRDLAQDAPKLDLAERISSGINNLNHIIENLLMFARDRDPSPVMTDIEKLLDDVTISLEPMLNTNNVLVTKDIDADIRTLSCDKDLLKQVFLNIFINACQAMPSGGELRLATNRRDLLDYSSGQPKRFIQIRIADTGHGIPPETKARIFDPFYTTKEKGTGLGLALVHKIVRAHGGFVGVDSTPGQGTIFTLMLPLSLSKENVDG